MGNELDRSFGLLQLDLNFSVMMIVFVRVGYFVSVNNQHCFMSRTVLLNCVRSYLLTVNFSFLFFVKVGDFGILVRSGFTVSKALFFNFLSALVALAGTALVSTCSVL